MARPLSVFRITMIEDLSAVSLKPSDCEIALINVTLPRTGITPGFITAPETVTRKPTASLIDIETCGFCTYFAFRRLVRSASSSRIVRFAAGMAPSRGRAILPARLPARLG